MTKSYWIAAALAVALSAPLSAHAQSAAQAAKHTAEMPYNIAQAERHTGQTTPSSSTSAALMPAMALDRAVPVYGLPPRRSGEVIIFGQPVTIR